MPSDPDSTQEDEAAEAATVDPDNLLWRQYTVYVDLFKFYVDITWKATTWFYAITGAILLYYFDNMTYENTTHPFLPYSLALPFILSLGLSFIYARGVRQTKELDENLEDIRRRLKLIGKPHVDVLGNFLRMGAGLFLLVGLSLLGLFVWSCAKVTGCL